MKKSKTGHLKRIKEKLAKPLRWARKLFTHFKIDPLKCSCRNTLTFQYLVETNLLIFLNKTILISPD